MDLLLSMNANESCFNSPVCNRYLPGEFRNIKTALIIREIGVSQGKELPRVVEIGTLRDANGCRFSAQETDTDPPRELEIGGYSNMVRRLGIAMRLGGLLYNC